MYNPWPVSVVPDHPEGHVFANGSRQESCNLAGNKSLRPSPFLRLVWVLSAFTLGGLYYFAYTDVGVVNAIKMLWKL